MTTSTSSRTGVCLRAWGAAALAALLALTWAVATLASPSDAATATGQPAMSSVAQAVPARVGIGEAGRAVDQSASASLRGLADLYREKPQAHAPSVWREALEAVANGKVADEASAEVRDVVIAARRAGEGATTKGSDPLSGIFLALTTTGDGTLRVGPAGPSAFLETGAVDSAVKLHQGGTHVTSTLGELRAGTVSLRLHCAAEATEVDVAADVHMPMSAFFSLWGRPVSAPAEAEDPSVDATLTAHAAGVACPAVSGKAQQTPPVADESLEPVTPATSGESTEGEAPERPATPATPEGPATPTTPEAPATPMQPGAPAGEDSPAAPAESQGGLVRVGVRGAYTQPVTLDYVCATGAEVKPVAAGQVVVAAEGTTTITDVPAGTRCALAAAEADTPAHAWRVDGVSADGRAVRWGQRSLTDAALSAVVNPHATSEVTLVGSPSTAKGGFALTAQSQGVSAGVDYPFAYTCAPADGGLLVEGRGVIPADGAFVSEQVPQLRGLQPGSRCEITLDRPEARDGHAFTAVTFDRVLGSGEYTSDSAERNVRVTIGDTLTTLRATVTYAAGPARPADARPVLYSSLTDSDGRKLIDRSATVGPVRLAVWAFYSDLVAGQTYELRTVLRERSGAEVSGGSARAVVTPQGKRGALVSGYGKIDVAIPAGALAHSDMVSAATSVWSPANVSDHATAPAEPAWSEVVTDTSTREDSRSVRVVERADQNAHVALRGVLAGAKGEREPVIVNTLASTRDLVDTVAFAGVTPGKTYAIEVSLTDEQGGDLGVSGWARVSAADTQGVAAVPLTLTKAAAEKAGASGKVRAHVRLWGPDQTTLGADGTLGHRAGEKPMGVLGSEGDDTQQLDVVALAEPTKPGCEPAAPSLPGGIPAQPQAPVSPTRPDVAGPVAPVVPARPLNPAQPAPVTGNGEDAAGEAAPMTRPVLPATPAPHSPAPAQPQHHVAGPATGSAPARVQAPAYVPAAMGAPVPANRTVVALAPRGSSAVSSGAVRPALGSVTVRSASVTGRIAASTPSRPSVANPHPRSLVTPTATTDASAPSEATTASETPDQTVGEVSEAAQAGAAHPRGRLFGSLSAQVAILAVTAMGSVAGGTALVSRWFR